MANESPSNGCVFAPWLKNLLERIADVALFYPLIWILLIFGEFFLAWWSLGHIPTRPPADPKSIQGLTWLHSLALATLMGIPAAMALFILNFVPGIRAPARSPRIVFGIFIWAFVYALTVWDPLGIGEWWFD